MGWTPDYPPFTLFICNRSDYSEYCRSLSLNSDILYLGHKDSSHCVHQQLLLLANHIPVHQLFVGALVIQQIHQKFVLEVVGVWWVGCVHLHKTKQYILI